MKAAASGALRWLEWIENGLIALLVLVMVLLAGAQILLRNLFETGIDWADPLLRALVLWTAMLGALAAARDDKHIGLDLLTHFLHGRAKRVLRVIGLGFAAAISAAMAWYGTNLVMLDYGSGANAFAHVPSWCVEAILPVGFAILALRLGIRAFLPPRSDMPALAPELP
jgi:TRAP-type C4-dicarboxylate transport system permease small subunit